jgi:hypothetical protein
MIRIAQNLAVTHLRGRICVSLSHLGVSKGTVLHFAGGRRTVAEAKPWPAYDISIITLDEPLDGETAIDDPKAGDAVAIFRSYKRPLLTGRVDYIIPRVSVPLTAGSKLTTSYPGDSGSAVVNASGVLIGLVRSMNYPDATIVDVAPFFPVRNEIVAALRRDTPRGRRPQVRPPAREVTRP